MADFSQPSVKVTSFHLINRDPVYIRNMLRAHTRGQGTMLIVPCLATEFTDPDNLPVFRNLLKQLKNQSYIGLIIFGLDRATQEEALLLRDLCQAHEIRNYLIQWNDGEEFSGVYETLKNAGFNIDQPGKGRNMFLSFGVAIALGAHSIGLIDADIRSFRRRQLDRLFYPVVVLDYDFAKAYYARISDNKVFGRVKRLLLDPLLLALKRKFHESEEEKALRLIDYLLDFKYQLSGEVAFHVDLLKKMRFATNWGVEIYTLIEAFRKASSIAQVNFTDGPFDHKHQTVSADDSSGGLNRMAVDIVTTLMYSLVVEEGLEVSDIFFRDLAITYRAVAEAQVKKYADDASFNNFLYDRDGEDFMVREVFIDAILAAGEQLTAPYRLSDKFLRYLNTYSDFKPFLSQGLAKTVLNVESKSEQSIFEIPQTVSWERVYHKMPTIYRDLCRAVERERSRFA